MKFPLDFVPTLPYRGGMDQLLAVLGFVLIVTGLLRLAYVYGRIGIFDVWGFLIALGGCFLILWRF